MGLVEDLDKLLQSLGFRKIADLTPEQLKKDITEKCEEIGGVGGCSASISGELVLWESQFPLMGAVGIYVNIGWVADIQPRNTIPSCTIDIEIIGEGDAYNITLLKKHFDECVYYA